MADLRQSGVVKVLSLFPVFGPISSPDTKVYRLSKILIVATLLLGDYPGLKTVAYNYQYDPMVTRNFSKRHPVDFSSLRLCIIECISSDPEFHEILADRWLRPLGNLRARELVAPMLCLPEHGGMVVVMRDWLGGEEHMMPAWDGNADEVDRKELKELLLDKEALKTNDVVVVAQGEEARRRANEHGIVRVGGFGYPIADATLAIVNPETSVICPPDQVGEIWVILPLSMLIVG
jgi:acyl-CoA synthetase (AMP-forming)/AMP-acid ligase II